MRIAIIGSGSSAFAAAIFAAEKGAKVTMIEASTIGGTCVNVGCVPSKIFIQQAFVAHTQEQHPFRGIEKQKAFIQRKLLLKQQQDRVDELREAKYESILEGNPNITLIQGFATLKDKNSVLVTPEKGDPQVIEADRILIATGSTPTIPAIPGLAKTPYWTSTEALQSDEIPQHLIIVGASFVALELAQAFLRLGSKVTLLARSTLLSKDDPQIGQELQKILEEEGMRILTHTTPQQIDYNGQFLVNTGKEVIPGDRLLIATGRKANVETIGLENMQVTRDKEGRIVVDEYMRTNVETVYASGDCTNQPQYVYVAAAAGTRAAVNMLGGKMALDLSIVPGVTFTDPQVATVGLTEKEAKEERNIEVESRTLGLENVPRALVNFNTRGFIKLVAEKGTGRLVGAHILAPEGGEMIQVATLAIRNNMTVNQLSMQLFPYLTMVEGLKLCAQIFNKDVKKLSCCADSVVLEGELLATESLSQQKKESIAQVLPFWQHPVKYQGETSQVITQQEQQEEPQAHDCCQQKGFF